MISETDPTDLANRLQELRAELKALETDRSRLEGKREEAKKALELADNSLKELGLTVKEAEQEIQANAEKIAKALALVEEKLLKKEK